MYRTEDHDTSNQGAPAQHHDDMAVDRFAAVLKEKLARSRAKGRGGWDDRQQCPNGRLQLLLAEHVAKGDPIDVAVLAMMLWARGESTRQAYAAMPTLPQFNLDAEAADALRQLIGEGDDAQDVTLSLGEIHDEGRRTFGLRAQLTEHPEEGALMLCELPQTPPAVDALRKLPFTLERRDGSWVKVWPSSSATSKPKSGSPAMIATGSEIALWQVLQASGVLPMARAIDKASTATGTYAAG